LTTLKAKANKWALPFHYLTMPNPIQKKHPLPKSLMRDLPFLPKWGLRGAKSLALQGGEEVSYCFPRIQRN